MTKRLPTKEQIAECLRYDPATGEFIWKKRPSRHFPHTREWLRWNTRFAGKVAGRVTPKGYRTIGITTEDATSTAFYAHRLAWLLVRGKPVPCIIDHIDGDKLNNRIDNLRRAKHYQNMANAKLPNDNLSGTIGVYLERDGRYRARVGWRGKLYNFGRFETLEQAIEARRYGMKLLHGVFARHE